MESAGQYALQNADGIGLLVVHQHSPGAVQLGQKAGKGAGDIARPGGAQAEALDRGAALADTLDLLHLGQNGPGVKEKFLAAEGETDALRGALENGDADLLLQLPDGPREVGLADIERICGLVDGVELRHGDGVFQVL